MKKPLVQLIIIQLKEFYREPGILFWGIMFPVLMAWGLGMAFSNKGELTRNIALVQSDSNYNKILSVFLSDTKQSINNKNETIYEKIILSDKMGKTKYRFITATWDKAIVLLKRGTVPVIIKNENNELKYFFDPMNNEAQLTYMHLASLINNNHSDNESENIIPLTTIGTRYIDFLIPGLIAMGIMMSTMWGMSYSLIEKRSKKLLRRLVATPMRKTSFLISHFVARICLSATEAIILFIFAHFYFDITIQGSITALVIIFLSGITAFTGIAIFASSRTAKTEIGNGLINAIVMPMMVVSGIFFSYHNFPDIFIPVIQKLPLTMLADGMRSIFIEGAILKDLYIEISTLLVTGIIFFFSGLKIYKWY